ncbi:hypothetical protein Scep_004222 [Stephania cephalantha]|uniref:Uncharacterized protein n=1 Tax=Stephania cephalantha TaxID=152367 RepID=A0AAP0KS15_9MAGN
MIPLSLPHIIIGYMTSTCSSGRHLPYAHIITSYLESAQVDLALGGRPLTIYDTIDMATLKAMKYRYIRDRQQWTREDAIPDGQYHGGYESPLPTDSPVAPFDAPDYLEYSYQFGDDDNADDEGNASNDDHDGDDEGAQDFTVPQQQQYESAQPPIPSTFGGFSPPANMSPSSAYVYCTHLGYTAHLYDSVIQCVETVSNIENDRLRRIEGQFLPIRTARNDHASSYARPPPSSRRSV